MPAPGGASARMQYCHRLGSVIPSSAARQTSIGGGACGHDTNGQSVAQVLADDESSGLSR